MRRYGSLIKINPSVLCKLLYLYLPVQEGEKELSAFFLFQFLPHTNEPHNITELILRVYEHPVQPTTCERKHEDGKPVKKKVREVRM